MRCPSCGTSHPAQYETCVSCGQELFSEEVPEEQSSETAPSQAERAVSASSQVAQSTSGRRQRHDVIRSEMELDFGEPKNKKSRRRSASKDLNLKSGAPVASGVMFGLVVVMVVAGAGIFFLTKTPEQEVLFSKGQKQIENGQYAFAVETLTKASKIAKENPKIMLALARAYVGVDQVDKAWDCISKAQSMGQGVVADPDLASQLANYYRLHSRYDKACDLLRPLAQQGVPGKKAELADLCALWGDGELRDGNLEKSCTLWEEVKDLHEGSRFSESDARLATIYQRLAEKLSADKKDKEALAYLGKLNAIADNARNYEMAADIYERDGQLELAIDQLRKASHFSTRDDAVRRKLAVLLNKRGKELLDAGDLDTGYGYLQQAKSVDPNNTVPVVTLKSVTVDIQGGMPHISGQVWNPGDTPINALAMRVELVDKTSKVMWQKESALVDEFVPPLPSKEGKSIDVTGGSSVKADGSSQFKVYFDGKLYNSYPIGKKEHPDATDKSDSSVKAGAPSPAPAMAPYANSLTTPATQPAAPSSGLSGTAPAPGPGSGLSPNPGLRQQTPEEKTMKDLE